MGKKNTLNSGEQLYSNAPLQNAELTSSDEKNAGPTPDDKKKKDKKKSGKPNIFVRIREKSIHAARRGTFGRGYFPYNNHGVRFRRGEAAYFARNARLRRY